jgi:Domain of unknown function (DUF222)/HNH endonuclease
VTPTNGLSHLELIEGIGSCEVAISRDRRQQLRFIREFDLREQWQHDGARHMGQWLAAHLGITVSEGMRRAKAAHSLERLPMLSEALEKGILSFEKVLQLARYLDPEFEEDEIRWAEKARLDEIKRKADVSNRPTLDDAQLNEVSRYLSLYDDQYGNVGISGRMPAADGALFRAAIEEMRKKVPVMPEEEPDEERQQMDALLALTLGQEDTAAAPGRATVVVHADLEALIAASKGAEIEGGPVIAPELASRMLCDADLELVVHDERGNTVGIGRASRETPPWLRRQLIKRDGGCTFPGCGTKRFLKSHHVVHWEHGGPTNLDNLTMVCHFHHKLVHGFGWGVALDEAQRAVWTRPDGSPFAPKVRAATQPIEVERTGSDEKDRQRPWGFRSEWFAPTRIPGTPQATGFG